DPDPVVRPPRDHYGSEHHQVLQAKELLRQTPGKPVLVGSGQGNTGLSDRPSGRSTRFTLEARGIRKSFGGVEVLHGVDLVATGGSVLALLGENGAGKSTLVKIIAGDYQPDAGEIVVGDSTHSALDPVTSRHIGIRMIFQELADAGSLSVAENIS